MCLGSMLHGDRVALDEVTATISGGDYYDPRHEAIHDAATYLYARGEPVDPIAVADHLRRTKSLTRAGGGAYLHELTRAVTVTSNAGYYADIVRDTAQRRRLATYGRALVQHAVTPDHTPVTDLVERARVDLDTVVRGVPGVEEGGKPLGQYIDDFLDVDEAADAVAWLVDGVLERQDRLIVTGGEGHGKSTLMRQLAVQLAGGIHPFTDAPIPPIKVLLLDLENTERQTRRKIRPLRVKAGRRLANDRLVIECHTEGLDLTTSEDRAWLTRLVDTHAPDLLITGPIYKMGGGNPNAEEDAKPVALALDALRDRHDMAVILEAHTRKAEDYAGKNRAKDVVGWSGWRRWPEFGLHLGEDGELTHWRGAREERVWPHVLNRGGHWPWTPGVSINEQRWLAIVSAIRAAGRKLTNREIADATGISLGTVGRIVSERAGEVVTVAHQAEVDAQSDDAAQGGDPRDPA